jgi:lipopolysaccharide export system permease protein
MKLPTALILTKLQDSFASPETISFWELPEFIKTLNSSGFSALRHSLYFYSLLMQPIFFCSMVLIGAAFSLRSPRTGMALRLMIIGGIVGFSIYFFGDLISALGAAGILPTLISALVPVTVSMLIGIMLILHLEDG